MRIISGTILKDETYHKTFLTERPEDLSDMILWCFDCKREHYMWEVKTIDLGKDLDYEEPDNLWDAFKEECIELNDTMFQELANRLKGTGIKITALVHAWSADPDDSERLV